MFPLVNLCDLTENCQSVEYLLNDILLILLLLLLKLLL